MTTIENTVAARRLARETSSGARGKPYVVVTTPAESDRPYIDPSCIEAEVGDLAEVFLIRTGPESWAFSREMPERTQVYGGAGRVYPVGTDWIRDPRRSPLRFAWGPAEGPRAATLLASDALRMAAAAGLLARPTAQTLDVDGTVEQLVAPSRALVRTDDRHIASLRQELLYPDVPIERLVAVGMRVQGSLDPHSGRYDVRRMAVPAEEALASYRPGDVVLARVVEALADRATLRLHPLVDVVVTREEVTSNTLDQVSSLMTAGEVLATRVVGAGPDWRLSLLDVDDDETPLPPPSLLRGGPPWLVAGPVAEPSVDSAVRAPVPDVPCPDVPVLGGKPTSPPPRPTPLLLGRLPQQRTPAPVPSELEVLRRQLADLRAELASAKAAAKSYQEATVDLGNERQLLHNQLRRTRERGETLEEQLRQSKTDLRRARQRAHHSTEQGGGDGRLFLDDEEQFRFEVRLAWAQRIPAAEKADRPLAGYRLGEGFLSSVASLSGIDRGKIADVTVEVLTGLARSQPGRELHQLRCSDAPDAPALVREDGAICWRVALQVHAPAARRLHYWQLRDGCIELSRVTVHDDYRP